LIDPFKYKKWELPIWEEIEEIWKNIAIKKNYEKILKNIDSSLVEIDKKLLILKYFTPKNLAEEKQKFIESDWEYIPNLEYEEINLDFDLLEKKLNSIEITDIPLASIFKRKKEEISIKINLLKSFKENDYKWITKYSSLLYWEIIKENLDYCVDVLENREEIILEQELLDFEEIKDYIKKFNHIYNINISLKKSNKNTRFVMKWDTLFIREWVRIWKKELRSIIAHEIEGHYLRKLNWKKSDYEIFSRWTGFYLETDEWIAVFNQNRFLSKTDKKFYWIFERYYFVWYALNHSYSELIEELKKAYNNDLDLVFRFLVRLKRGLRNVWDNWVFVKDIVYLNWYLNVKEYLKNNWNLEDLYIWKINLADLYEIKESYFINFDFSNLLIPFFVKK
jgi:hypothetical protein